MILQGTQAGPVRGLQDCLGDPDLEQRVPSRTDPRSTSRRWPMAELYRPVTYDSEGTGRAILATVLLEAFFTRPGSGPVFEAACSRSRPGSECECPLGSQLARLIAAMVPEGLPSGKGTSLRQETLAFAVDAKPAIAIRVEIKLEPLVL
jgi:hypothetical protein